MLNLRFVAIPKKGQVKYCSIGELLYSYPTVVEAAVIGIPDKLRGTAVHAYIVTTGEAAIDKKRLKAYLQERLAAYKIPREKY